MSNYLPVIIKDILMKTGWRDNEILVYSILLSKGAMGLSDLSIETGISISTLQYVIKKLLGRQMIIKSSLNKNPIYSASDIDQLRKWVKGYSKQFESYEGTVSRFIDQYDFNPQVYAPRMRMYEGVRGVKQSYKDMLNECQNREIFACFSVIEHIQTDLQLFFIKEYVPKRVSLDIVMRNVALETPKAIYYKENDSIDLRETKLLAEGQLPLTNSEINLYDDKIHCMNFNENGAFATIIQDRSMSDLLKAVFKVFWNSIETNSKY